MLERRLLNYQTAGGKVPFREWFLSRKIENNARNIVLERLHRLSVGNPGYWAPVGKGIFELKIDYGPGYRIYYSYTGKEIILLLCAGNKQSQKKDIQLAQEYWEDYRRRTKS